MARSFHAAALLVLAFACVGAQATFLSRARPGPLAGKTDVLFVNNSQVTPGFAFLYGFDFDSKSMSLIHGDITGNQDYLSSSIVCDDAYYGAAIEFPFSNSVGRIALSKNGPVKQVNVDPALAHSIKCAGPGSVIALLSTPQKTSGLVWTLVFVNVTSGETKQLAELEAIDQTSFKGSDAAYSFTGDGKELWVGVPVGDFKASSGKVLVYDGHTGSLKATYSLPDGQGWPYGVFAPEKAGDNNFGVVLMTGDGISGASTFYQASLSGSSVNLGPSPGDGKWLYNGGQPPALCGDVGYSVSIGSGSDDDSHPTKQNLYKFNRQTGALLDTVQLEPFLWKPQAGGLACP